MIIKGKRFYFGGKSKAIDALIFLSRIASGVGIFQAIGGDVNLSPLRGGMDWVCRKEIVDITTGLAKQLSGIFVLDPIPNHMRDYSPLAEKLSSDGSNIAGVLAALSEEKRKTVQDKLTSYLKKIPEKDM